jgi:hypothetical protein
MRVLANFEVLAVMADECQSAVLDLGQSVRLGKRFVAEKLALKTDDCQFHSAFLTASTGDRAAY